MLRATGVEWEIKLPFAGLHQLCAGLRDGLERLPAPQREALSTAFGLSAGAQPDPLLVGLAVLSLLSDAAEEQPLVCVVDDVQWLDRSSMQVLAFLARRLDVEPVVLLFAERDPGKLEEIAGLPALRVGGLSDEAAREVLASVVTAPLDEPVRDRILAETRGNPLALLELLNATSTGLLAGGFGLLDRASLPRRIEANFRLRVEHLPTATQRLLLAAAADPTGEPALLVRAAEGLGIASDDLAPAEADGLLHLGPRVTFRHPLLRSAIYRSAPSDSRRAAHRALAAATNAEFDPDHRAWHRAHATVGPDDDVADELERSAARARARGGLAAAGAFLERAATLTTDPGQRARRSLQTATTKELAGDHQSALALLAVAAAGPLDEVDLATIERLRGQILLDRRHPAEAAPLLTDAARRLEPVDARLARDTHFEAVRATMIAGRLAPNPLETAAAARAAPPPPAGPRAIDQLTDALADRFTDGYVASAAALGRALAAVRAEGEGRPESVRWPWNARRVAPDQLAEDMWRSLAIRGVQLARESGALAVLPVALHNLAHLYCLEGELDAAAAVLDEADTIVSLTGIEPMPYGRLTLAGCRGDEAHAVALFDATDPLAAARGEGNVLTFTEHARAVLYNGLGRYEAALGRGARATATSCLRRCGRCRRSWRRPRAAARRTWRVPRSRG